MRHHTPDTKADLRSRMAAGGFSATVHGPKPLGLRHLIVGLAAGAMMSFASPPAEAHDIHTAHDGDRDMAALEAAIPADGSAELITMTMPSGEPMVIINGGGVRPDKLAEPLKEQFRGKTMRTGPLAGQTIDTDALADVMAKTLTYDITGPEADQNPAVATPIQGFQTCIIYQHRSKAQGLSVPHDHLQDPAVAPNLNLVESLPPEAVAFHKELGQVVLSDAERADREAMTFLHEANHCHLLMAVEHAKSAPDSEQANTPTTKRVIEAIKAGEQAAQAIARETPGANAGKMASMARLQVIESAADVFALLAMHQDASPEALREHAERMLAWRDPSIQQESSHDTSGPLMALADNAEAMFEQAHAIRALENQPTVDPETLRVRGAQFNDKAFDALSSLAVTFALEHLDSPEVRIRNLRADEVVTSDADWDRLDAEAWSTHRNAFQAARPQQAALETIKQQILEKAHASGNIRAAMNAPEPDPENTAPSPGR